MNDDWMNEGVEKENKIKKDFREEHLGNNTVMRKPAKVCFHF